MADDWFRGPDWDESAREMFEARLRRARKAGRPQYLRIKAAGLIRVGKDDDAAALLQRSIDQEAFFFETVSAWEMLGGVAARRGETGTAIHYYRQILDRQPSLSGTSGDVYISLADVFLDAAGVAAAPEALALFDAWTARRQAKFNVSLYQWHFVRIRVAQFTGDHDAVRTSARTALELADSGPQLPRHGDFGVVRADDETLTRLRKLSRDPSSIAKAWESITKSTPHRRWTSRPPGDRSQA